MIADDAAARRGDRLCVARALVSLAGVGVPAAALGAGDIAAVSRVERLMRPAARLGLVPRLAVAAAMTLTALAPLAIAATPGVAAHMQYCPVTSGGPAT